jgi:HD-like signal output (HDOD) protein
MLKKLFSKLTSSKQQTVEPLSIGVIDSILGIVGSRSIPPMVGSAQKAFKVAIDPKADARDFVDVIQSDESLSARIIKVANSVYFDRGKKSTSIEEAVQVIGLNELRGLLNASSLSSLFPSNHPGRPMAWNNDIATGIIAKQLCQQFAQDYTDSAFLAGLMHDIGKLLLMQRVGEQYSKILSKVESDGTPFHIAESEEFPFDHTEVGQLIAQRWGFTDDLKLAIRNHHLSFNDLNGISLAGIIKCADMISYIIGAGGKQTHRLRMKYEENISEMWQYLNVAESDRKSLLQNLSRSYEMEADLYRQQK